MSESARVRLAHLALGAAEKVPGVVGTDAGPGALCVTADPEHGVLRGVSVIAQADNRYEVNLCLNAKLVPLPALGETVASAVRRRIERKGLGEFLGEVRVEFAQVLTEAEIVAERARTEEIAREQSPAAQVGPLSEKPLTEGAATMHVPSGVNPPASSQPHVSPEPRGPSHPAQSVPASADSVEPCSVGTYTFIIVTPPSHATEREREP